MIGSTGTMTILSFSHQIWEIVLFSCRVHATLSYFQVWMVIFALFVALPCDHFLWAWIKLRALFLHVISLNNEIADPKSLLPSVYWSCQFIARASNVSLKHWQQMGGINIDENILIDKTIHKAINSKSSVLKVCKLPGTVLLSAHSFFFVINISDLRWKWQIIQLFL